MRNDRYGSLDGIKGLALIGIIWYHLSQRSLPGGFIGVDVFFTVSGAPARPVASFVTDRPYRQTASWQLRSCAGRLDCGRRWRS